jgi:hypothetical protein
LGALASLPDVVLRLPAGIDVFFFFRDKRANLSSLTRAVETCRLEIA